MAKKTKSVIVGRADRDEKRVRTYSDDWFVNLDKSEDVSPGAYSKKCGKSHRYFVKVKSERLAEILAKLGENPKSMSVLDVGCGLGESCVWLAGKFKRAVGVDNSRRMIAWAERNVKSCDFYQSNAGKLPFDDSSFDCAVFFNVFHHMESKRIMVDSLREVKRVVKKGGFIFISELNPKNPVVRHTIRTNDVDVGVNLGGFRKNIFPTTLNLSECRTLFKVVKLKVKYSEYLLFFPSIFNFFYPLEGLLHWLPLGGAYFLVGRNLK